MKYEIEFSDRARGHLDELRKRDQQLVVDAIETRLSYEPAKVTRNRKPLADNPLAPWELRVGNFRAFYDTDEQQAIVVIVAIGHKVHNKLYVGGEEIEL
jgi:mRNA-degrading endonuclease RelE of RelBE toxin-antitoxin system